MGIIYLTPCQLTISKIMCILYGTREIYATESNKILGDRMRHKQISSETLEDILREDGILEQVDKNIQKKVLAEEMLKEMTKKGLTKASLARTLHTSRAQVDRILDPRNTTVTLDTIFNTVQALGKHLKLQLV